MLDGGLINPVAMLALELRLLLLVLIANGVPIIATAHPSPMSADRGFFGSRPFSRVNRLLTDQGGQPVDWSLPDREALT